MVALVLDSNGDLFGATALNTNSEDRATITTGSTYDASDGTLFEVAKDSTTATALGNFGGDRGIDPTANLGC